VGAPFCHTLQGHCETAPVVKLQLNGALIVCPEEFWAPETVAVYVVLAASELVGVNVATVLPALKLTAPGTVLLPASLTVNVTVLGTTAWLNVALGAAETATPVDPAAGATVVTEGGVLPAVWV
jgi:hypothetical protein